jgi:hypothetical protein
MPATYEPIATTTLGSAAATITFSSISSAYTDLRLVLVCTTDTGGKSPQIRLNSDSGTNYSMTELTGDGATAATNRQSNRAQVDLYYSGTGTSATIPMMWTIDFFSYAGSTNKTMLITRSSDQNGSGEVMTEVSLWRNTSAIDTILLRLSTTGNYATGTTATLYGILRA